MDFIFAFSKPKIFKKVQKREKSNKTAQSVCCQYKHLHFPLFLNNSNFCIYVFVPVSCCVSHMLVSTCGSFLLVAKLIVTNRFQWYDANVS